MVGRLDGSGRRRVHPRVNATMSVQYKGIRQANDAIVGAIARDISGGGINILSNEFLSIFTRLILEISVPSSFKPVTAVSKVAWVRKRPHGEQYEIGIQFLEMNDEDSQKIREFIERSTPKK